MKFFKRLFPNKLANIPKPEKIKLLSDEILTGSIEYSLKDLIDSVSASYGKKVHEIVYFNLL